MNSAIAMPIQGSRPKIHRLPAKPVPVRRKRSFFKPFIAIAAFTLVLSATVLHTRAALPKNSDFKSAAADKDTGSYSAALSASRKASSVVLKDDAGRIVGQLAKVPPEAERITDVNIVSDIDKKSGRDLLSIVSQY